MNGTLNPHAMAASAANGHRPSASASPATMAGNTPTGAAPNGPPRRRKPRPSNNPLRAPRRPLKSITKPVMSLTRMNEKGGDLLAPSANGSGPVTVNALRNEPLSQGARLFPFLVSRKDLKELRRHVMKLQSKDAVDLRNEQQFTAPIRLHRRDPRAPPSGAGAQLAQEEDNKEDIEESKERERMEIMREGRRKIREENQAKIAPSGTKKQPAFQKKTEQKYRPDDTPEAKKRMLLKYEETLPWHLEDFDNKQTWVGTYESELSNAHMMLTVRGGQAIQMLPLERWYKFGVKSKAKSTEDPEGMKEVNHAFFKNLEDKALVKQEELNRGKAAKGIRTRVGGGGDDTNRIKQLAPDDDTPYIKPEADGDDLDYNQEDDFADDEEGVNGLFEGDDLDVKEAAEKLKRDQLAALANMPDEHEIEREERRAEKEKEDHRLLEKAVRKTLIKREKNLDYETDNENPYASESDSETDSETERLRTKEEEDKKAAENAKALEEEKPASGASTKGANTPVGNHRPTEINKKKRPGSPNLSEASGNESSRKKHKKKHDKLADGPRKTTTLNQVKKGAPSQNTPGASPIGSRAGSPAAPMNGSRASSPASAHANAVARKSRK
jgi:transcription initiation factor TFIIF subunit alpha